MSDRIAVGRLVGVFGVKGWVKVKSNTQPAENIINYAPWYLKTSHGLKEVEIDEHAFRPQGLAVHFKGCDDRDVALSLGKATIEVDMAQLPNLDDNEFYWHQLVGLKVYTVFAVGERKLLGEVASLMETGANDVFVVRACDGSIDDKERLVPYGDFVKSIDVAGGEIDVDWDPDF